MEHRMTGVEIGQLSFAFDQVKKGGRVGVHTLRRFQIACVTSNVVSRYIRAGADRDRCGPIRSRSMGRARVCARSCGEGYTLTKEAFKVGKRSSLGSCSSSYGSKVSLQAAHDYRRRVSRAIANVSKANSPIGPPSGSRLEVGAELGM